MKSAQFRFYKKNKEVEDKGRIGRSGFLLRVGLKTTFGLLFHTKKRIFIHQKNVSHV
jgi:hypothetical protein